MAAGGFTGSLSVVGLKGGQFSQAAGSELADVNFDGLLDRVADHKHFQDGTLITAFREVKINNGCSWVSETEFFLDGYCFSFSASSTAPQETCPEGYLFGRSLLLPSNGERTETALYIV